MVLITHIKTSSDMFCVYFVAHLLNFCLFFVSCSQCLCLWICHLWLPLWCSLTFFNTVLFFTNVHNKTMAVTSPFWAFIYCKTMAGIIAFCTILAHSIFIIWEWHGNLYSVLCSFYSHGYYLRMAGKFVLWTLLTVFTHAKLTAILSEWKGNLLSPLTNIVQLHQCVGLRQWEFSCFFQLFQFSLYRTL